MEKTQKGGKNVARPKKTGLDYFPLDVYLDDKFKFVEIKFKLEGFAIVIKLLQKIYANGYYIEWGEDEELLFTDDIRAELNTVREVVKECLKRDIFSKTMYDKYKVLTSRGIQKRYMEATKKRTSVTIDKQLDLVSEEKTPVNSTESTQSKVKESKVNESKVNNNNDDVVVVDNSSKNIFKVYESCGFGTISSFIKDELEDMVNNFTFEWTKEALEIATTNGARNLKYVRSILNNWKSKGKDYKPKQYKKDEKVDSFNNYDQREYDFDELEKKLLGWDKEDTQK